MSVLRHTKKNDIILQQCDGLRGYYFLSEINSITTNMYVITYVNLKIKQISVYIINRYRYRKYTSR